ncbi:MAG TPA: hypothetical protein PLC76_00760 [Saprospiraceae bacterium]|nr:MAG: HhH-GPD family protein [Candidatus Parvibacillus calidus]MCC7148841.1 DNA-3-methyladenine glycosylase 2 family protein [Saprospiraceae bacterium]MBK7741456.1 DNA-3-methyladenine glycosylase 2 family protein [Candidatus Parvibacillus calidus]HPB52650.1 hypothetical protein [Saprospiraceae bacterium]HRN32625.1 hypothetical protein [Saprospiraceae bacterium]
MKYLPEAIEFLYQQDAGWAVLVELTSIPEFGVPEPPYIELMSSIVSQQLSTKVAKVIWNRFVDLFPRGFPEPSLVIELSDLQLREIGFSNAKANYVKNIAGHFLAAPYTRDSLEAMDDLELLKEFSSIKGVGEWTVQMLQIFNLHRPDILPVKDLGVRQAYSHFYGLNLTERDLILHMNEKAEKWRPYRSAASLLLWNWKNHQFPGLEEIQKLNKNSKN